MLPQIHKNTNNIHEKNILGGHPVALVGQAKDFHYSNITSDVFHCYAPGKKSPWTPHPSLQWSAVMSSCSITWCKLWQQYGWQLLYWNAEGCTSMYAIFPFKSTNLNITVCGILIERDCFKMFELLRIWSISQFLAAPFSHCKAMIDNIISSDMCLCPWPLLPLPVLPIPFHHASLLLFFLSAVDPDGFLDVHPSSEFVTFVLSSVYILSNWRVMKCTFELFQRTGLSLVDLYSLH